MTETYSQLVNLAMIGPELLLAGGGIFLLLVGVFTDGGRAYRIVTGMSVALLLIAGLYLISIAPLGQTLAGAFILDEYARYLKILIIIGSSCALLMGDAFFRREKLESFELPILVVFASLGMMLMVSANDLIALYMSIELQALCLYVAAAINRDNLQSTEAGIKYFVLGALSSGMMLYGMSLVYGFTGQTGFHEIAAALSENPRRIGIIFGMVFILVGMAFKVAAVPFHMWTPDVYQGAPTPVTAFFATSPKIASMGMLTRLLFDSFYPYIDQWQQILVFIAIASMVLGSFAAISQSNIKRLMAYSSIAHTGYILAGLSAGTHDGLRGATLYLTAYLAMTLGVFACILSMRDKAGMREDINDLGGLWYRRPMMAVMLAVLMWSLAGLPPFFGFFAKWYVFVAAVEAGLYGMVIVGVLTFVVGAYYYLRIVKIMFFDQGDKEFIAAPSELRLVAGISSVVIILFIISPSPIMSMADMAAQSVFSSSK